VPRQDGSGCFSSLAKPNAAMSPWRRVAPAAPPCGGRLSRLWPASTCCMCRNRGGPAPAPSRPGLGCQAGPFSARCRSRFATIKSRKLRALDDDHRDAFRRAAGYRAVAISCRVSRPNWPRHRAPEARRPEIIARLNPEINSALADPTTEGTSADLCSIRCRVAAALRGFSWRKDREQWGRGAVANTSRVGLPPAAARGAALGRLCGRILWPRPTSPAGHQLRIPAGRAAAKEIAPGERVVKRRTLVAQLSSSAARHPHHEV